MKNVLILNCKQARAHFLKEESYINLDLPRYFTFKKLLSDLSKKLDGKSLSDFYKSSNDKVSNKYKNQNPSEHENVNYTFLQNKDGRFSWRPLQLIHPAIYVSLVHKITEQDNWDFIQKRFKDFGKLKGINCYSLPQISQNKLSDKAANITNWWEFIEQKSIEKALEYEFVLHTDISDCYGSIYTHSISWALHTKQVAKKYKHDKKLIGNIIDRHLQDMSYGQTNGIPQGSVLMDFIAEMVLGSADLELNQRIKSAGILEFEVIRYRDDYRIFTNNPQDSELIIKNLTEILINLGLRLNPNKTFSSKNIVEDSIKPDKLFGILNKKGNKNLQEHLFLIHNHSNIHPNSGTLIKALNKFFIRVKTANLIGQNIIPLISIVVDIAFKNPRSYPISAAILSKLFTLIPEKELKTTLKLIIIKFRKLPNTGHMEIWLQRSILNYETNTIFQEKLCRKLTDSTVILWNSEWVNKDTEKLINDFSFVNKKILKNMETVLSSEEIDLFINNLNYSY